MNYNYFVLRLVMKKNFHELNFFNALENGEEKTQKKISSEIAVSIGMANALIKRFLKKGLIKVQQAPYKRFVYYRSKSLCKT